MKETKTEEAKTEVTSSKILDKSTPTPETKSTANPKKSKKGCCLGIAIVLLLLFFSSSGAFGFFSFFPWHGSSYDPSNILPNIADKVTNQTTTPNAEEKTPASSKSSSTKSSTSNNQTAPATTDAPSTPANNVTTTTSQPGAGTQEPPATGAQVQTVFTKQEQIDFFVQVAMKNDLRDFAVTPIQKWKTTSGATAKIKYFYNPSGANLACADATISQINALSNTIHFSKTTANDWQIAVYFKPMAEIGTGIGGYYNLSTDVNHYTNGGNAFVPSDAYNDVDRCHYIRHEMTHVMTGLVYNGLKNHGGYDFSIFNVSAGKSDYLEVDKDAIKIMLNSGVGLGWSESQVRNFLANANW